MRTYKDYEGPTLPEPCACLVPIHDDGTCAKCGRSVLVPADAEGGGIPQWSREQQKVLYALCEFVDTHGRLPRYREWPRRAYVKNLFGTWKDALRAAGFTPPPQGRKPKTEVT